MPKRDEEEYEERRRQIIRGALAVFSEVGYEKATNREIARRAGIGSPGLIYHYFKDKADLFGQVMEQVSPGLHLIAVGDPLLDRPPHEMLPALGGMFLDALTGDEGRPLFRMVLGEALRRPELAGIVNSLGPLRAFTFMTRYLAAQMDAGALRRADPGAAAHAFIGPLFAYVITRDIFPLPDAVHLTPDEMVATTVETFLRGMDYRPPARRGGDNPMPINFRRLFALIRKEFIQIVRDPRTLGIALIMPVAQLFLLGYAATTDVRDVPLAVWDQDRSPAARALLDAYRAADYFVVAYDVDSEAELRGLIDGGQARAGLIIPPDYGERIAGGQQAQVALVVDGSDPAIASTALSAATMIGQTKATNILVERAAARGQPDATKTPVEVRTQVWYNPDLLSAYYMVPALIGMILMVLTTMLTATAIVRERERGTIEQLIVTPLSSFELIVGKVTPYIAIAAFDMLEILVIGMLLFGVPLNGSLPLLLMLTGLFLLTTLGLGLFASTIANTQQEAMMTAYFFILPSIFLSGFPVPGRQYAVVSAGGELPDPVALLSGDRAEHHAEGRGAARAAGGCDRADDLRHRDHGRLGAALPQAAGLIAFAVAFVATGFSQG